jgi:hypothetical protein
MRARVGMLLTTHVALVIASLFVMDWVIRGRLSADLWAVSACTDAMCISRPLDDAHATTTIWQTLLFSSIVIWQGGARALGLEPSRGGVMIGNMVGGIGALSVALMALVFARDEGLTWAPFVLGAAYVLGFVTLRAAIAADAPLLATARRVASVRASRRA